MIVGPAKYMPIKILITGRPHSGKSTLIGKIINRFESRQGFITREIMVDGKRTGFEIVLANGDIFTLADTKATPSPYKLSRYFVRLDQLERAISRSESYDANDLLYLDEIGQMELFSDRFKDLTRRYLDSDNNFVGTLSNVYSDDFINELKTDPRIKIYHLTTDNRNDIESQVLKLLGIQV